YPRLGGRRDDLGRLLSDAGDPAGPRQRPRRPDRGGARVGGAGGNRPRRSRATVRRRGKRLSEPPRAAHHGPRPGGQAAEPRHATVHYPGGLTVRYRWVGSGQSAALFGLSESGGALVDHGPLAAADPAAVCRAEMRAEGPGGVWTARFASPIYDEPQAVLWDVPGILVVAYGFRT